MTDWRQRLLELHSAREGDLVRATLQYLSACHFECWRSNVVAIAATDARGVRRYVHSLPKGFADVSAIVPPSGRALFVECKSLRGQLTASQAAWQARMRAQGGLVLTIRSIDDLRQGLRAAGLTVP